MFDKLLPHLAVFAALVAFVAAVGGSDAQVSAADVTLIQSGKAKAAIFVPADVMAEDKKVARSDPFQERDAETHRQRLRESVTDLAYVLEQMSGAEVAIHQRKPTSDDKVLPILVGAFAEEAFGPLPDKAKTEFGQGYRLVVSDKGVGFMGQTGESASYAIYELLDRLGCRWFIPGQMGEHIPQKSTVALPAADDADAPDTGYRGVWYADADFQRRNRLGGFRLSAGHALDRMISEEDFKANPEWNAERGGERKIGSGFLCWGNPEVAKAVSETIIKRLDANYVPSISLSPKDGVNFCQCEKYCKPLDAGDWDPTMGTESITDRYIVFCNRIAEHVGKKYPDVKFGFLAYVQYTRPPVREKPHPNLVPQIAPITYCRAHAMTSDNCPSRPIIKPIVEGWGKAAKRVSYYNYMFHLAEVAVPYPMIRQMSAELPVIHGTEAAILWQPETMANFESVAPGMWLTLRMAWDSSLKPEDVLDDFFKQFHGSSAEAMERYWTVIDNAWMDVDEHAGSGFGHARRFTPEVMAAAREAMDEALDAAQTATEFKRVKLFDESLRQFERFMELRWDLANGRLRGMDLRADVWMGTEIGLCHEYTENYAFTKAGWSSVGSIGAGYFNSFFNRTYQDVERFTGRRSPYVFLSRTPEPLRHWQYSFIERDDDPSQSKDLRRTIDQGEAKGFHKADFDASEWPTTDTAVETWASLGLLGKYGTMWYRTEVKLPKIPDGKKLYLWIPATDGSAKVFVNGKHVPFVPTDGEPQEVAKGYCSPFTFDVTEAAKPGETNQVTIAGTRLFINELGTGGLLGPPYFYRDK